MFISKIEFRLEYSIVLVLGILGHGKGHKDAASVRATHLIPAACGIYYFEVKIVSKGRDGSVISVAR